MKPPSPDEYISSLFSLKAKTALVTGGNRGIGRGIALALASAGANIILLVRQPSSPSVLSTVTSIEDLDRTCHVYACDLSSRSDLLSIIPRICIEDKHGIDILINCGGLQHRAAAEHFPSSKWDEIISVNLTAGFLLSRELARHWLSTTLKHPTSNPPEFLLENGRRKKIIFVASVLTFSGSVNVPAYVASKGAVGQLTMALNNEWMGRGICVNAVAPGYIATELTVGIRDGEEKERLVMSRVPAGRWGVPEDLAGAVIHLASRSGDYVGGETHIVDGGFVGR